MLFMIIERLQDNDMLPIYQRIRNEGRMFPEGLKYIDSWVEPNFSRCFQLMECDDLRLLQEWILKWRGSGAACLTTGSLVSLDVIIFLLSAAPL
jgi:Protein of unknown function (DUF3303)